MDKFKYTEDVKKSILGGRMQAEMRREVQEKIIHILKEEIVPAEGCTEPIAIAYAAAKLAKVLEEEVEDVQVYLSGNIIKNVKSVTIPSSEGMIGMEAAVAMGLLAGDAEKELMVISEVRHEDLRKVRKLLSEGKIHIYAQEGDIKLYIRIEATTKHHQASIEIKHTHTNITSMKKDGKTLISQACNDGNFNSPLSDREILNIRLIYDLAKTIPLAEIEPLFCQVIAYNSAIAEEGLRGKYGVNIGKMIEDNMKKGIYGNDIRNKAASYASAGSDARMSGCSLPVMTTSGSGNQGMTASLPVIRFSRERNLPYEDLVRGLFVSHMTTIHVKTKVGRLSAYCGAICAASGVAAAITFLEGGTYENVCDSITNILGNLSGIICDGAKASCAMKISSGVYSAFDASMLALNQDVLRAEDGIVGHNIEETIKNIGELAQVGMRETDEVILDIMVGKK